MRRVDLTWDEVEDAARVGLRRQLHSLEASRKDTAGAESENGYLYHIEGAIGEAAFAKGVGVEWDHSVDKFCVPDVAGVHVRTRSKDWYDLIIRPGRDDPSLPYALVTGSVSVNKRPEYKLWGWIYGHEAEERGSLQNYGGRGVAWFIPIRLLRPIETVPFRESQN